MSTKSETDARGEFSGLAFVGGHPGLNFLNTIKFRGAEEAGDRLSSFDDIARWALSAGLVNEAECQALLRPVDDSIMLNRLHREICAFREAARIVLDPEFHANSDFDAAAECVEREIARLRPTSHIHRETGELTRGFPIDHPRGLKARIVDCVRNLLEQRRTLRIKVCEGHDCDWVFADHSKAGRRKWCDTRTCGNAARVRAHRARAGAEKETG